MAARGLPKWTAVLGLLTIAGLCAGLAGVRVNTSSSLPLGLYVATRELTATLIEFCPEEPYASLSRDRGYRVRGFACPDGAVPLMKHVVARAGDGVRFSPEGIAVNGRLLPRTAALSKDAAGRPLQPFRFGSYVVAPGTIWVASSYGRGSFDSRYFGPVSERAIRRRLRPLWLLR